MINHSIHTSKMTQKELADCKTILATARIPSQRATLEARLRTGQRIGTGVKQGRYQVCLVLYALGKRTGEPTGHAEIVPLSGWLLEPEVVPFIEQWNPMR